MQWGFTSYEEQLMALAESGRYEITKADQLATGFHGLAELTDMYSQEQDALQGEAADAARAAFARISGQMAASAQWVDQIQTLIGDANAQLGEAMDALNKLPSLDVDHSAWAQAVDTVKDTFGADTALDDARQAREATAEQHVDRIDTNLRALAADLKATASSPPDLDGRYGGDVPTGEEPEGSSGSDVTHTGPTRTRGAEVGTTPSDSTSSEGTFIPAASWATSPTTGASATGDASGVSEVSVDGDLTGTTTPGSWDNGSTGARSDGNAGVATGLGAGIAGSAALAAGSRATASRGLTDTGSGAYTGTSRPTPLRRGFNVAPPRVELFGTSNPQTTPGGTTPGTTTGGTTGANGSGTAMMGGGAPAGGTTTPNRRRTTRDLRAPIFEDEDFEPRPLPRGAGPGSRDDFR